MTSQRLTFICAGSGDPKLLPVKAHEDLHASRCVLIDAAVVQMAASLDASVEVVEIPADATLAQRARRIKDALKRHETAVRVIAGDPILDGSLIQEVQALQPHAAVEVIPGVLEPSVAAAYAGISPIAGRTRELRIIDGANPSETLIVLNGADDAAVIFSRLIAAGRKPSTPFRIVRKPGTVDQTTVIGELGDADDLVASADAHGRGVIFVGDALAESASWFETKPLFGWQILMPRTKDELVELSASLHRFGAVTTHVSTLSVEPPRTPQQMEKAVTGLASGRFGWIVFTCANAFTAVWDKCREYGLDARVFAGVHLAAVGSDTVAAMETHGLVADLVPAGDDTTAALLSRFPKPSRGLDALNRVLVPRADIATETLSAGLADLGWEVEEVTAFRTVRSAPPEASVREAIKSGGFDAAVFTSSATVRNLIGLAGKPHARTVVVCIGARTAKTAEEHGLRVDVIAEEPTHSSLTEALVTHAAQLQAAAVAVGAQTWRPSQHRGIARRKAK